MNHRFEFPDSFFVTGTDTEVGKTVVSAVLAFGLKAGYWKPVQAGLTPSTDTKRVKKWTEFPESHFYPERYRLNEPMSPHAAAELENIDIHLNAFTLPSPTQKHLIVEGAGGLMVPLNRRQYMTDLIEHLELPVLLVARSGLGTINHTLLSLEILRKKKIPLIGVVLNGERNPSNEDAIQHFGRVNRVFTLLPLTDFTPGELNSSFQKTFSDYAS
ncbi:MAG: dethiobiotin synthase [Balneolaceae bacterium]